MRITDSYTGEIANKSVAQRRILRGASIVKASVSPMDNNVYLLTCTETGETLLIDAANDVDSILSLASQVGGVTAIFTTHQHHDHWVALAEVRAELGVPTIMSQIDSRGVDVPTDRYLGEGDQLTVGNLTLDAIALVGHTPGSIALALTVGDDAHIFTGDSLFPGGVGKTATSDNFTSLLDDVTTKIFDRFPDNTVVYPGHGSDTTLGVERPHLTQWRARGW